MKLSSTSLESDGRPWRKDVQVCVTYRHWRRLNDKLIKTRYATPLGHLKAPPLFPPLSAEAVDSSAPRSRSICLQEWGVWLRCRYFERAATTVALPWWLLAEGGDGGGGFSQRHKQVVRHFIFPTLRAVLFYCQAYITESISKPKQVGETKNKSRPPRWVADSSEELRRSSCDAPPLMRLEGPSACNSSLETYDHRNLRGFLTTVWLTATV